MTLIIQDTAHKSIDELFEYLAIYSVRNAIEIVEKIYNLINNLPNMPYMGKSIPKMQDTRYRELIYRQSRNSYRIIYYTQEESNTIYVLYVTNCKQNFRQILKLHKFFYDF